jgi:drug/metabolite transporter (DMT)-like permease
MMDMIGRFFTRLMALIFALSVFAVMVWLALNLEPEGTAGWAVLSGLVIAGAIGAFLIYHLMVRTGGIGGPYQERTGAGMMLGMGYEANRDRADDDLID